MDLSSLAFNEIIPGLILGDRHACFMYLPRLHDQHNVQSIIRCLPPEPAGKDDLGEASALEIMHELGLRGRLLSIPIDDDPSVDIFSYLEEAVTFLENERDEKGHGVLVYCMAGASRSATIVMAYLMKTMRLSVEDALLLAKEKRQHVHPNIGFMFDLMRWEDVVFERCNDDININTSTSDEINNDENGNGEGRDIPSSKSDFDVELYHHWAHSFPKIRNSVMKTLWVDSDGDHAKFVKLLREYGQNAE
eukprot:PhM_4_TR6080/c0_g1_i1/m.74634